MKPLTLNRRSLLRGAAGTALALPWLEAMQPERRGLAQAAKAPKRFIVFMTSNGTFPERFWPMLPGQAEYPVDKPPSSAFFSGPSALDITDHVMGPSLKSLERYRSDVTFVEGLNSSGNVGHAHWSCSLTGQHNEGGGYESGGGISLDQQIANHLGADTKFKSLQLGVLNRTDGGPNSWFGQKMPALAENNPKRVFDRVFAEVGAVDTTAVDRLRRQRKSVLDAAVGQIGDLRTQLGAADRAKLQNYTDSLREVELRLTNATGGVHCEKPSIETGSGEAWEFESSNAPLLMKTQLDLLAMSLACDLTRVITLSFGYSASSMTLPWLGINTTYHDGLSHAPDNDAGAQANLAKADEWTAQQFVSLIERLKAIPEGDGTVFDNSVILWTNEMSKGNSHDADNIPIVLAGTAQGFFRSGRYVRLERKGEPRNGRPPGRWTNDLLVTLQHSMGIDAPSFGDPTESTAPLDVLKA